MVSKETFACTYITNYAGTLGTCQLRDSGTDRFNGDDFDLGLEQNADTASVCLTRGG